MKVYARRVESMLREYQQLSNGQMTIRKLDPEPDSDAEDSARLDGVTGQPINLGESIYLGVAISMLDRTAALPFLSPNREELLEYDLSRAISQVVKAEKPVVGVMSALPVMGMAMNPMMMRMGQMQGSQPWALISELQRDFDVREIPLESEEIEDDVNVLLLIHPKDITEGTQYAIDQFVLRGGRLIAMLDPMAISDQQPQAQQNPMGPPPSPSTLDKLLPAWGLDFDNTKVVADMDLARELSFQRGQPPQLIPTFLFVGPENIDRDDVSTAQIDDVWMPFPGAFSGTPVDGLEQTILLNTTDRSQLVEGFLAQMAPQQISKDFVASGKQMPLAIRLTGRFKTAFPDGKPGAAAPPVEGDAGEATTSDDSLKESGADGVVILIGDVDMANDNFSVQQMLPGIYSYRNGNISLIQSLTEQLAGDSRLIGARSRATMNRPFTKIRQMQSEAEKRYRDTIAGLEEERQQVQQRINELQSNKEAGQRFVLSPEQQKELEDYQQTMVDKNKELKRLRRDLRKDIDAMENRLKLYNIAGMPILIILVGVAMAIMKNKRTAAK
jgi:ABC-type uncharacterized transport system involved in gliding motility auxiliary subunit